MKKFNRLIQLILFLIVVSSMTAISQNNFKIVVFTDLDATQLNVLEPDGSTMPMIEELFYKQLKATNDYGPYTQKSPFSTFFVYNDINDYDVAIFPMGDLPLSYSVNGHSVIGTINQMLNNGKRVLVTGRKLLWNQFDPAGVHDASVGDFFTNKLGIQYLGRQTLNGSTAIPYVVYSPQEDTVTWGHVKYNNVTIIPSQSPTQWPPFEFYDSYECFKLKPGSGAICMDYATKDFKLNDKTYYMYKNPNDSAVGVRVTLPNTKIAFWSIGFENSCSWESIDYNETAVVEAVRWLYKGLLWPKAYLTFDQNVVDYGSVEIDGNSLKSLKIINYGRTPMEVNDHYFDGYEPDGSFVFYDWPGDFTLNPGESKTIQIQFFPTEERKYSEMLSIGCANCSNGGTFEIELKGWGGPKPNQGPQITYMDTLDFGKVPPGSKGKLIDTIVSSGTSTLIIDQMSFTDDGNGSFDFDATKDSKVPFTLEPDSIHIINFRFVPVVPGQQYTGVVKMQTNIGNNDYYYIYFKGEGQGAAAKIQVLDTLINYDSVNITGIKNNTITITNTGNAKLTLDTIEFLTNKDGVFSFVPESLSVPLDIPQAEYYDLQVKFSPKEADTVYTGQIKITSNANNKQEIIINLIGVGRFAGIKDGEAFSNDGSLSVKAYPNPLSDRTVIQCKINNNSINHIDMSVIDMLGNTVANITNQDLTIGVYQFEFNSVKLSSGTYFVVAKSGNTTVRLPIVIQK